MRISSVAALALLVATGCSADEQPERTFTVDSARAPTTAAPSDSAAAAEFVQSFYDAYLAAPSGGRPGPAWGAVLRDRADALDPSLLLALRKDAEATAAADEIVGLDFDPFLNSQDPCAEYQVGDVSAAAAGHRVAIHGVCDGARSPSPDVVAEVVRGEGGWRFVNFHYPAINSDLLAIIAELRNQ